MKNPLFSLFAVLCLAALLHGCAGTGPRGPELPATVETIPPAAYTKGTPSYEMRFHTALESSLGSRNPLADKAVRTMNIHAAAHLAPAGGATPAKGAAPLAYHMIPAGMGMGGYLALGAPDSSAKRPVKKNWPVVRLYWGGGDAIRQGQPKVIHTVDVADTGFLPQGKTASFGLAATGGLRPGWVEAVWPGKADARPVPATATLAGQHFVHGNFLPHMRFTLDQRHDFMPPLAVAAQSADLNGPLSITWNSLPNAVAYHVMALAYDPARRELILWNSSEDPNINVSGQFLDSRLAKRQALQMITLSADATRCVIPKGVFAGAGTVLVTVTAWGEDFLFGQPAPPPVLKNWDADWVVKGRFLSTGTLVLGSPDGAKALRDMF